MHIIHILNSVLHYILVKNYLACSFCSLQELLNACTSVPILHDMSYLYETYYTVSKYKLYNNKIPSEIVSCVTI